MSKTPAIYLADLRHNYTGVLANDCMPLGVAYLKAVMDRDLPEVHSRLFAYPHRLHDALQNETPDVLMLSNYVWNEELSFAFARIAKLIKPNILTVMGGPNIPIEPERQIAYVSAHPEIDVYILGEADFLATDVTKHFIDAGLDIKALASRKMSSAIYRDGDGGWQRQEMWDRHRDIDAIPSVWLTGILDEFFDGKLAPMIETNRGCPFTCSFCVQGTGWYTKVHNFEKPRIQEELQYIAKRIKSHSPSMGTLRIADSNYGMFERDVEISGYIGEMQKAYGWPTFIDATTGKNRADRIIQSLEKVSGALVLYQAVQSLDETTLKNVKRGTIKLEAYEQIQVHIRGRGLRSNSDLILGLPGETLKTHVDAIHKLVDAGTSEMHNFQSMMLKGSEMEKLESRRLFRFDSRFRVLPKNFGVYGDEKVFDMDEIVVATETMPFDDYLRARKYHMTCSVFWNNGWFADVIQFVQSCGIKPSQWLTAINDAMHADVGAAGRLLASFEDETKHELFPTREACIDFYTQPDNFQRLMRGDVGDNLMYKYRALASFQLWPDVCRLAMSATRDLLKSHGVDALIENFDDFWADFANYTELRHADGISAEALLRPARASLRFDIGRWMTDGMPRDVAPYRYAVETWSEFHLPAESAHDLAAAVAVWTTDLKGLSKLVTRIRPEWQVRECRAPSELPATRGRAQTVHAQA
jgi:radical SAM superfamily enzyme YgiQ (UPF0313 family)